MYQLIGKKYIKFDDTDTQEIVCLISHDPSFIDHIPNPPEYLQVLAVQHEPTAIRFIKWPTKKTMKVALQGSPAAYNHIWNPGKEIQLYAVSLWPHLIERTSQTEDLQIAAVSADSHAIRWITNPTERVQMMAVQDNPKNIKHIENPCDSVAMLVKLME